MQSRGSLDSIYQTENVSKFKVVVLGDQGVGKSALVWKFVYNGFEDKYQPTIGIDFFTKTLYLSKYLIFCFKSSPLAIFYFFNLFFGSEMNEQKMEI